MRWLDSRRLLVVRADNIGDVLMTAPAIRALREALPGAVITLLASPAGSAAAPLLPGLDEVWTARVLWQDLSRLPFDPARELGFIDELAAKRFDAAIVFTSFSQSPHPAAFAAWLAGIPLRAGASRESSALLTDQTPFVPVERHQVDRNLALVEALGIPVRSRSFELRVPRAARDSAASLLAVRRLRAGAPPHRAGDPYVLLNPWATAAARTYDPERSMAAARLVALQTGWPIVVTSTAREAPRTRALARRLLGGVAVDVAGATTVAELAALVERARLLMTCNTAAMHMADALRTPAVVVYSGTELESQWAPRQTAHVLLRKPTTCTPCYAFDCPYDHECVDFTPAEVAAAALDLLAATRDGERLSSRVPPVAATASPRLTAASARDHV